MKRLPFIRIGSLRHSNAQMYDIDQVKWSNEDITVLGVTVAHQDLVYKNYTDVVNKIKPILDSWVNRGLSLLEKVHVVNTMISSLFVHKMMVLPTIPKNVVKNVDNMIRNFIWNGKKSKIAYKTLQNPKTEGGLNLVDLIKKDKALKATWPQILHGEEHYSQLVYKMMKCQSLGDDIWRCNLDPSDVDQIKIKSDFWVDVLRAWCEYNHHTNFRIDNQLIWYNSNIRVEGKPILWSDAQRQGLLYVAQLFHQNSFKAASIIKEEYGLSILRYNSLKSAIPKEWINFFCERETITFTPKAPHNYDLCINVYNKNFSRKVYKFLAEDITLVHNKYMKWRQDLGSEYDEGLIDFKRHFSDLYHCTNVAKYRSFQYRLLQRGLVTNTHLYKWKLVDTELCTFCKESKETLIHLFVQCPIITQMWNDIAQYCCESFGITSVDLSPSSIIFNRLVPGKKHVINFICLITKQFIYRHKCQGKQIHFPALKAQIRNLENIEKYIAEKNDKVIAHESKWRPDRTLSGQSASLENAHFISQYIHNM